MYCTVTSLTLRRPWGFFRFSLDALRATRQLARHPHAGFRKRGFGLTHCTMTLWPDAESLRAYAREGAHREAMRRAPRYAREVRVHTFETDALPDWATARRLLDGSARVTTYR